MIREFFADFLRLYFIDRGVHKPMQPPNPHSTTHHQPSPATPEHDATTEHVSSSPPFSDEAATILQDQSKAPESVAATVSIPDYQIECVLGRGGMGVVYKARHVALKRTVALKMVLAGGHAGPRERARFRIEAEAVARLVHPNIVQIHEVGEADGLPYCALEFIDGGTLAERIDGKPLPAREAARLVELLARAMQLAHSRNVVHRDLKPANILLSNAVPESRELIPKITDFGLARQTDSDSGETQAGTVMGTPSYMAPEQASGHAHEAGPAADVYALGAILYHCLTGRPPFKGKTVVETLDQVRTQEPEAPSRWQTNVPLDLETICLKCLRKEPENRYASAAELADDLGRFLRGEPVQARPLGRVDRTWRWCRRNPAAVAFLSLTAGIFLTAFVLVSWSYFRAEDARKDEASQRRAADDARGQAERREKAERWERYRSNMVAAASAMQLHNVTAARGALEAAPEEHRGWEWHHLVHQLDLAQEVKVGPAQVTQTYKSPDGKLLAVGSAGGISVWDAMAKKKLLEIPGVQCPDFPISPNGRFLAYSPKDTGYTPELWDIAANRRHAVLRGHSDKAREIAFSPDSARAITGSDDKSARVWDTATGAPLFMLLGHESVITSPRFSPNGKWIATAGSDDLTARLWDATTGTSLHVLRGHSHSVMSVRISPRGDRVITAEYYPGNTLRLWDPASGQLLEVMFGHTNEITTLDFSPDGGRFASASRDQTVRLWDGRTGKLIAALQGHAGHVRDIAFSPDSKRLVSASQDQTVRIWDAVTGASLAILHGHTSEVVHAAYSPDGTQVASVSADGNIRWWDAPLAEQNGVLRGHTNFAYGVAFHPDGQRVASAAWDGTVRIWDTTSGKELAALKYPKQTIVTSVAFHPDGKLVASLGRDDAVRLWDLETGTVVHSFPLPSANWRDSRLAFSPKGDRLAAGSHDMTAHLWDMKTQTEIATLRGHTDFVRDVTFSPDGTWLASAGEDGDKSIRIWNLERKEMMQVLKGHANSVYCLAVSRDGKWLASGALDGTVRLWDTATWQEAAVLQHGTIVYSLSFHPDGKRLACACANNTIRLWDLATRQSVVELHGHTAYVHQVAFSPDGTRLVSASGDKTVRVWDSLSAQERARKTVD